MNRLVLLQTRHCLLHVQNQKQIAARWFGQFLGPDIGSDPGRPTNRP